MSDAEDKPVIDVVEVGRTVRRPVDEHARARYLDVLRQTGSRAAAAAAARPHLRTKRSAMSVMEAYIAGHPHFAAQVADIEATHHGEAVAEIRQRALHGVVVKRREIETEGGTVVEEERKYDNKLLVQWAKETGRRVDEGAFVDKRTVHVTGGTANTVHVADLDKMLDSLDSDALKKLAASARDLKNRALLEAGEADDVEDAELVDGGN